MNLSTESLDLCVWLGGPVASRKLERFIVQEGDKEFQEREGELFMGGR